MTTLLETKILGALQKARNVGIVEETFALDGCSITVHNLRADEYTTVLAEIKELEDAEYLYAFQTGHLCRAIVEINGIDLRDIDYVDAVAEDGKKVSLERHEWVRQKVVSTWGREALATAYRKLLDAVAKADRVSTEGITFVVPDENAEDKLQRLFAEIQDVEEELPSEVFEKLLGDKGYLKKTSKEEAQSVERKLANLAQIKPKSEGPTPEEIMRNRRPLNQEVQAEHVPQVQTPSVEQSPRPQETPKKRSLEIAALEAAAIEIPDVLPAAPRSQDIPVLDRPVEKVNPNEVAKILDTPPIAGINPRFHRPSGL